MSVPPSGPWGRQGPPDRGPRHRRIWLWLAIVAVGGVLVWLLSDALSHGPRSVENWSDVAYLLVLIALVSSGVVVSRRFHLGTAARNAGIWAVVGAVLLLGYSYREDLRRAGGRMLGELMPGEPMVTQAGTVELRRGPDGHFHVVGTVNGTEVLFLVDTGASGVVLNQADARRIGFDPGTLAYTQIFNTANGQVTGAPVRLASMGVGPIVFRDVGASVNGGKLDRSLLGMSFLNRLSGFEIEGDRLTLRP